jgi:hypothetical protein
VDRLDTVSFLKRLALANHHRRQVAGDSIAPWARFECAINCGDSGGG